MAASNSIRGFREFPKSPEESANQPVSVVDSKSIAFRNGQRNAFNIVYAASEMILGDSFAIKILESDTHFDTCFTFGVTSCLNSQIDEFPESHHRQLCANDTICNGICNSITLRNPIFKRPDSIICFRRCQGSLIEISVNGTVHETLEDHSENSILTFVPSLVPFFVLNGAVSAIMYWPNDSLSIIDTVSRVHLDDSSDASSINSSSSDVPNYYSSDEAAGASYRRSQSERCDAKNCTSPGEKVSIGVGTHEDTKSGLIPWDPFCVICFTRPRSFVTLPCFHFAYCEEDAKKIIDQPCAICRIRVKDIHVAYFS